VWFLAGGMHYFTQVYTLHTREYAEAPENMQINAYFVEAGDCTLREIGSSL